MNKAKLCYGQVDTIWESAGKHKVSYMTAMWGERPTSVKRKRLRCPKCGRKLWSSVRVCHDGCCLLHSIPPHKPKGWWKKRKAKNK